MYVSMLSYGRNVLISIVGDIIMDINKLRNLYNNQDDKGLKWPIYITVMSLKTQAVVSGGIVSGFDGKIISEFYHPDDLNRITGTTKEDLIEKLSKNGSKGLDYRLIKERRLLKKYEVIEFFLTANAALKYIQDNNEKLISPITNICSFSEKNIEMNMLLSELRLKTGD